MIFLAPQQKSPAARGECVCGRCGYTGSHFQRPPRRRQGTHGPFSQRAETALEFEHRALASEQPSLGQHCSPPCMGKGPINPGLKIACLTPPGQLAAAGGDPFQRYKKVATKKRISPQHWRMERVHPAGQGRDSSPRKKTSSCGQGAIQIQSGHCGVE